MTGDAATDHAAAHSSPAATRAPPEILAGSPGRSSCRSSRIPAALPSVPVPDPEQLPKTVTQEDGPPGPQGAAAARDLIQVTGDTATDHAAARSSPAAPRAPPEILTRSPRPEQLQIFQDPRRIRSSCRSIPRRIRTPQRHPGRVLVTRIPPRQKKARRTREFEQLTSKVI